MKLQESFYLWGQSRNSHYGYGFGESKMTPVEGCRFFGIDRCCRVAMRGSPAPPFDEESREMDFLKEVVWSIVGAGGMENHNNGRGDLDEVIRQAKLHPNITGGVLDDFFVSEERRKSFSPDILQVMKQEMCRKTARRLSLWVVVYENNLDLPIGEYLNACDVVSFWTWKNAENLHHLERNFEKICRMTPGKRHMNGVYLYDYGNHAELSLALMKYQCCLYEKMLLDGRSDGLILCSNCCADVGLKTVDWTRSWLREIGKEEFPRNSSRPCGPSETHS